MSWVSRGVDLLFPAYKSKNTLERFSLRGVIGKVRGQDKGGVHQNARQVSLQVILNFGGVVSG